MDWVEKVFHISPDGGNGSFELVIYLVLSLVVFMAATGAVRHGLARRRRR
jgi:hypothetical protein